jgi:hypothetical protein
MSFILKGCEEVIDMAGVVLLSGVGEIYEEAFPLPSDLAPVFYASRGVERTPESASWPEDWGMKTFTKAVNKKVVIFKTLNVTTAKIQFAILLQNTNDIPIV